MSYMRLSICLMGIGNSLDTMLIGVLLMACRILVKFNASDIQRLSQHRRYNSYIKKRIVSFIQLLLDEGFHHFIIFINQPIDYWIAELLYFMMLGNTKCFIYSLVFFSYDKGISYDWLDYEWHAADVIESAQKIIWRHSASYGRKYIIRFLDLQLFF